MINYSTHRKLEIECFNNMDKFSFDKIADFCIAGKTIDDMVSILKHSGIEYSITTSKYDDDGKIISECKTDNSEILIDYVCEYNDRNEYVVYDNVNNITSLIKKNDVVDGIVFLSKTDDNGNVDIEIDVTLDERDRIIKSIYDNDCVNTREYDSNDNVIISTFQFDKSSPVETTHYEHSDVCDVETIGNIKTIKSKMSNDSDESYEWNNIVYINDKFTYSYGVSNIQDDSEKYETFEERLSLRHSNNKPFTDVICITDIGNGHANNIRRSSDVFNDKGELLFRYNNGSEEHIINITDADGNDVKYVIEKQIYSDNTCSFKRSKYIKSKSVCDKTGLNIETILHQIINTDESVDDHSVSNVYMNDDNNIILSLHKYQSSENQSFIELHEYHV